MPAPICSSRGVTLLRVSSRYWCAGSASAVDLEDAEANLAHLLWKTAEHHDPFEKDATQHKLQGWYAADMYARQHRSRPDEASQAAARYMEAKPGRFRSHENKYSCPTVAKAPSTWRCVSCLSWTT